MFYYSNLKGVAMPVMTGLPHMFDGWLVGLHGKLKYASMAYNHLSNYNNI
jgi:hypothetical protein